MAGLNNFFAKGWESLWKQARFNSFVQGKLTNPYHPCMVYLPTFAYVLNGKCRYILPYMDGMGYWKPTIFRCLLLSVFRASVDGSKSQPIRP